MEQTNNILSQKTLFAVKYVIQTPFMSTQKLLSYAEIYLMTS